MLAVLAFVVGVIAALLQFLGGHTHVVIWLLIIAVLMVSAEVAWGVHRAGWYRRVPPA